MKVVPLSADGLTIGRPLPFSVRDGAGLVLLSRGALIQTDKQLQLLRSRELFIDPSEAETVKRAYTGQLDQMLRQEVALGRIATARPDYTAMSAAVAPRAPVPERAAPDWPEMQMHLRLLLVDPHGADWLARLRALRDEIGVQVARNPDRALMRLMHDASNEFQHYSANHSLFVCVLATLSSTQLPGWNADWHDALSLAALTMNIASTQLQDELARQVAAPSDSQRAALRTHADDSVAMLRQIGVDDPLWLEAVRQHHVAEPGPMSGRPPEDAIARLIRRADRYAARLSPRKSRPGSSATVAAQSALLDEGGHGDEAGQAIVRTLGIYPPGVWVKLHCGEIALVLRRSASAKAPVVVSVVGKSGMPFAVPVVRNTRLPAYEVTGALAPSQVKVRPNLDALEKLG